MSGEQHLSPDIDKLFFQAELRGDLQSPDSARVTAAANEEHAETATVSATPRKHTACMIYRVVSFIVTR
ncbi:hypothetical protein [Rhodococcus opacus]|uniref:hypothetical protein n=1 Tax=Rhodococcus opacus TaxID=37919 RepID=UPI001C44A707|nr:hypothetical protein [Rhodococcus opacus]MBV6759060.1 hypothetical protein [Rhodococcus opacus]